MFNKKEFAALIKKAQGERTLLEFSKDANVDFVYLTRFVKLNMEFPPSEEIIRKLAKASHNGLTFEDFKKLCSIMENISKSKIDRAGSLLVSNCLNNPQEIDESIKILDWWRQSHLHPLTEVTLKIQQWLKESPIYIGQRLKRKPQIIRKLSHSPSRLTQLQDIGGCRVIFESLEQLEAAIIEIRIMSKKTGYFMIKKEVDYRTISRDSGYRGYHIIVERQSFKIEIQLRTKLQHLWAEAVERASIESRFTLKEGQGPIELIHFFKHSSDMLFKLENHEKLLGTEVSSLVDFQMSVKKYLKEPLEYKENTPISTKFLDKDEKKINNMLLKEQQGNKGKIINWLIVFDWKVGKFIHWSKLTNVPKKAAEEYSKREKSFPYEDGFEVVLIGADSVKTLTETHSHYFNVKTTNSIDKLIKSIIDFNQNNNIQLSPEVASL